MSLGGHRQGALLHQLQKRRGKTALAHFAPAQKLTDGGIQPGKRLHVVGGRNVLFDTEPRQLLPEHQRRANKKNSQQSNDPVAHPAAGFGGGGVCRRLLLGQFGLNVQCGLNDVLVNQRCEAHGVRRKQRVDLHVLPRLDVLRTRGKDTVRINGQVLRAHRAMNKPVLRRTREGHADGRVFERGLVFNADQLVVQPRGIPVSLREAAEHVLITDGALPAAAGRVGLDVDKAIFRHRGIGEGLVAQLVHLPQERTTVHVQLQALQALHILHVDGAQEAVVATVKAVRQVFGHLRGTILPDGDIHRICQDRKPVRQRPRRNPQKHQQEHRRDLTHVHPPFSKIHPFGNGFSRA